MEFSRNEGDFISGLPPSFRIVVEQQSALDQRNLKIE
jgi:hypothetical protein